MLIGRKLSKRFGARTVFRDLNFQAASGQIAAVVGSNGAGKSTLLRIVASLMRPTQGVLIWRDDEHEARLENSQSDREAQSDGNAQRVEATQRDGDLRSDGDLQRGDDLQREDGLRSDDRGVELRWMCGLAAPDAPLPRELTASENLRFIARVRGLPHDANWAASHLERFGLRARRDDLTGDLSSGLRARLQLAAATLHSPQILLLDEPSANLDEAGRAVLQQILDEQRNRGLVLLATNDEREVARCDFRIEL